MVRSSLDRAGVRPNCMLHAVRCICRHLATRRSNGPPMRFWPLPHIINSSIIMHTARMGPRPCPATVSIPRQHKLLLLKIKPQIHASSVLHTSRSWYCMHLTIREQSFWRLARFAVRSSRHLLPPPLLGLKRAVNDAVLVCKVPEEIVKRMFILKGMWKARSLLKFTQQKVYRLNAAESCTPSAVFDLPQIFGGHDGRVPTPMMMQGGQGKNARAAGSVPSSPTPSV